MVATENWSARIASQGARIRRRGLVLSIFAIALAALAAPGDVSFAPPVSFVVGSNPVAVAAGDFNEDGMVDAVVANSNSGNVSALLGNGNGTFGPPTNLPVGSTPSAVVLAKLNNDQHLDLAVANMGSGTVSIRLGSGTSAFGPVVNYAAGSFPMGLVSADFDGDGDEDLAVADFVQNRVSLLLNHGDGSFAAPVHFAVGTNPRALVAGDFNGDSKMDIAAANDLTSNVSILLGNGDGTFAPRVNYAVGLRPFAITAGDFNGDNHLDLATGNQTSGSVSVLRGNGDGTFAAATNLPLGVPVLSVVAADFNADNKVDLAAGSTSSSLVTVLPGNGDGTFRAPVTFAAGGFVQSLALGDWNGDSLPDLAAPNGVNTFAVLLNTAMPPVSNQPPSADAGPDQTVECAGANGALVHLSGTASDPDGDALTYSWTDENGAIVGLVASVQVQVPQGTHTFTLTVDDGHGNTATDTVQVTVGDSMPPSLTLFLTPNSLWPANHAMVEVTARISAADSCSGSPSMTLLSITSSEPDNGRGDGDLPNDIQGAAFGTDDRSFWLRAERSGKGAGRAYTVRYAATDAAGNAVQAEAQVFVPHDNGSRVPAGASKGQGPK